MSDWIFNRSMNAIQEQLVRDDVMNKPLGLQDDQASKTVELIQKSLNELGQRGLLGSDYKPLEVTGKSSPEFIAAFREYLAIKRPESTDWLIEGSYKGLPDVKSAADIKPWHVSAIIDSLHDNDILRQGSIDMKPEILGALKEINSPMLGLNIENLQRDLKELGYKAPEQRSEAANDERYLLAAGAPVSSPIKPV